MLDVAGRALVDAVFVRKIKLDDTGLAILGALDGATAVEAVAGAVADARVSIGGRKLGMGRLGPRLLDDLGGPRRVSACGEQASGDAGGRNERRGEAVRFERERQRLLGILLLE
ncbi:MAG TPA: hypothetical protein PK095_06980, partial [Myxococcota bacterium]|nr:hypothetical protein [Myxococcota bacterium]